MLEELAHLKSPNSSLRVSSGLEDLASSGGGRPWNDTYEYSSFARWGAIEAQVYALAHAHGHAHTVRAGTTAEGRAILALIVGRG